MKLDARRVSAFLRDPGACRVVLLHGEDDGVIREWAEALVRAVAGSISDPFRIADLDRDQVGRLAEEARSLSLMGGRRVVRLRGATDAVTDSVMGLLAGPGEALVVLEGGALPSRSRLRTAIEAAPQAVAIACRADDDRALRSVIQDGLTGAGVSVTAEALDWLVGHLGGNRGTTRQEIEKLILFAGPGGRIDLTAAMAGCGDLAGLSLDDALFAATAGDVGLTDRALELALSEGASPVGVLRAGLMHLQSLHRARLAMRAGIGPAEAARSARPPVFFRRMGAFTTALGLWNEQSLFAAASAFSDAERACKRTGAPDEWVCRQAILTLARRAAGARRR